MGSLDAPRTAQLFTFGCRGQGISIERVVNGLKKSAKNKGSQWHAQSAHCAHTGHVKGKCGFSGCPRRAQLFTFGPRGQGISLRGS